MRRKLAQLPNWIWLSLLYCVTHVPFLTLLPVFADEAIYIRWAQLIIDDASRYAFFSLADGKPPLFIWILSLTLRLFSDPLWIARLTSVAIGLATVFAVGKLATILSGRKSVVLFSQLFTIFLPFWWFYHRMALMDGLLTLCITLAIYFSLKIARACQRERKIAYDTIPDILLLAVSFGGALLTKTPAMFAVPVIASTSFFALIRVQKNTKSTIQKLYESVLFIGIGGLLGGVLFLLLRISPFFGALFSRSSEYRFTIQELLGGEWKYVLFSSLPREIVWTSAYLTVGAILLSLFGLYERRTRKTVAFLLGSAFIFAIPLIAFGRVLYPRYFLPIAPFVTIAAAIGLESLLSKAKGKFIGWFLLLFCGIQSMLFIIPGVSDVGKIPFVAIDRTQYIEEWSAGFGNREVYDFIVKRHGELRGEKRIIVLTEGSFGTLPDGLFMYFYGPQALEGVEIHGIGVAPNTLPQKYLEQQQTAELYYAVNSHRFALIETQNLEKILEIPRPGNAPSLVLYRVRSL